MEVIGLASGGKDSCFNMLECVRLGHRIVAIANLLPAASASGEVEQELDSHMIQTVGHTALEAQAAAMGVPLVRRRTTGRAIHTAVDVVNDLESLSAGPEAASSADAPDGSAASSRLQAGDEVFDLLQLLRAAKRVAPGATAVAVGALLSNYQRTRVEHVCACLGLQPIALLWRCQQPRALRRMIASGLVAVPCKVASLGLPATLLGKPLAEAHPRLARAALAYGVNIAGEGGEYETLTLSCPGLFLPGASVSLGETAVHFVNRDKFAPVAHLVVSRAEATLADGSAIPPAELHDASGDEVEGPPVAPPASDSAVDAAVARLLARGRGGAAEPVVREAGGVACVSVSGSDPSAGSAAEAVASALAAAFEGLASAVAGRATGSSACAGAGAAGTAPEHGSAVPSAGALAGAGGCQLWRDVVFVRLWVSSMSDFASLNAEYCKYFGHHPPSRACVQVGPASKVGGAAAGEGALPSAHPAAREGGPAMAAAGVPRVALEAVAVAGAGAAARGEAGAPAAPGGCPALRWTHHVRSLSRWAPLCIGPYCQANVVAGSVLCAGQIGLDPATMRLVPGGWPAELDRAMLSCARVLAAEGSALQGVVGGVVFVSEAAAAAAASAAGLGAEGSVVAAVEAAARAWLSGFRVCGAAADAAADAVDDGAETAEGGDGEAAALAAELDWSGLPMREFDEGEQWGVCDGAGEGCPLAVVVVPALPRGAAVEVELVGARRAALRRAAGHPGNGGGDDEDEDEEEEDEEEEDGEAVQSGRRPRKAIADLRRVQRTTAARLCNGATLTAATVKGSCASCAVTGGDAAAPAEWLATALGAALSRGVAPSADGPASARLFAGGDAVAAAGGWQGLVQACKRASASAAAGGVVVHPVHVASEGLQLHCVWAGRVG
ncbi:hypothetical protein FNF29_07783 [Cafeteria roenbergensis]|uniref:Diphthine--ammonia ligase n=1 Tax=Cafeteria roenbergensis TaxID=33653 RepID=A0A5A8C2D2_CAFRO|nr:hypothetical protein FNF29_07783 [Cafeteria roenbergensis]|eukprot:KAA0146807.1 hypothetical protein FNF29_07783 [Cafeteria roenbergensis]